MPLTVAGSLFLARHKSLGVEETPVGTATNLVDDVGLEINVERSRDVLARGRLREESAEAIVVVRGRALEKATVGLENNEYIAVKREGSRNVRQDRARRCRAPLDDDEIDIQ